MLEEPYQSSLPQLFSEWDAAQLLGCAPGTLPKARKQGLIGYVRLGKGIFYTEEQLQEYLDLLTVQPQKGE